MSIPGTPDADDVLRAPTVKPISGGEPKMAPDTERPFSSYMKSGEPNPLLQSGKNPQVSPFDLAHGKVPAPGPTFASMQEQTKMASTTMGDIQNQLKTPKLKLKQSTKYLLKNKLNSANGHIASAASKLGTKTVASEEEEQQAPSGSGVVGKFLGLITSGQNQLQAAQDQLTALSAKGDQMKPADMLLVQIKLSKAQQELEYSSMLLGKAMDDMKTLMNVQL